ncbi:MAG: hypothetical protein M1824_006393 [Vezdaea acicularis]|nr:MAG: hypothetical protein M1824_006393 [Vezdaea acicularis]
MISSVLPFLALAAIRTCIARPINTDIPATPNIQLSDVTIRDLVIGNNVTGILGFQVADPSLDYYNQSDSNTNCSMTVQGLDVILQPDASQGTPSAMSPVLRNSDAAAIMSNPACNNTDYTFNVSVPFNSSNNATHGLRISISHIVQYSANVSAVRTTVADVAHVGSWTISIRTNTSDSWAVTLPPVDVLNATETTAPPSSQGDLVCTQTQCSITNNSRVKG